MTVLTQKDQRRILDHVQKQGVNVVETKKGYLLRLPDGETEMMHKSQSDYRGVQNMRAKLKRSGISWPFDGERPELPKYITERTMRESTLVKYRETLRSLNDGVQMIDEITASELAHAHWKRTRPGEDYPKNSGTVLAAAFRALYRIGYQQTGFKKGKDGLLWEIVVPEKPRPTQAKPFAPEKMFAPEPEPVAEVITLPAPPDPAPSNGGREFLDSVDSFTLHLDTIADIPVETVMRIMRAAGLELEIRVWKP